MHTVREWKHPENYLGATWEGWFSAGFGRSRDSDALEESNFQVAWKQLRQLETELSPETHDIPGRFDGESSVQIVREGHWAVGWVEWIAIHESNTAALDAARKLCDRANDYPVLDEDHWGNLEYERAMNYWDSLSLNEKVNYCRDCRVSIFAARRSHDLPDRLYESLCQ